MTRTFGRKEAKVTDAGKDAYHAPPPLPLLLAVLSVVHKLGESH